MFVQMIFSLCVDCVCSVSPELLSYCLTKLDMVVYFQEAVCQAEKLVHYLQCHGHSEGLYNQNMTIFTISSKPVSYTHLTLPTNAEV